MTSLAISKFKADYLDLMGDNGPTDSVIITRYGKRI